ncbi:MAG: protoheme IX farnesyltransferase [Ignavibacteria bacterium]
MDLCKVRITFFVALTTSVGYLLFNGFNTGLFLPTLGVFLLACGSSALNHYQEKTTDALMERTKNRPIPSGRIKEESVVIVSLLLIISGSLIIYFSANLTSLLIGWITLSWYNIIYTPMKKINALAVIPGSLIGALPPVIGWVAAGGNWYDVQILAVALFFFIWQIPHFWLLLLIFGKDYERAGFPTLTQKFANKQLSRITFVWIAALSVSCLLIPFFGISKNIISIILLLLSSILLLWKTKNILVDYIEKIVFRKAFLNINLYVLIVIMIISIDKLL